MGICLNSEIITTEYYGGLYPEPPEPHEVIDDDEYGDELFDEEYSYEEFMADIIHEEMMLER